MSIFLYPFGECVVKDPEVRPVPYGQISLQVIPSESSECLESFRTNPSHHDRSFSSMYGVAGNSADSLPLTVMHVSVYVVC